jgi:hypothetical protein
MTPDVDDDRIIRPNIDDWTNENPEPSTEYQDTVWVIVMSVIAIFLLALFGASLKKQQNRSKDTEYNVFKLRGKRKDASTTEGDEEAIGDISQVSTDVSEPGRDASCNEEDIVVVPQVPADVSETGTDGSNNECDIVVVPQVPADVSEIGTDGSSNEEDIIVLPQVPANVSETGTDGSSNEERHIVVVPQVPTE